MAGTKRSAEASSSSGVRPPKIHKGSGRGQGFRIAPAHMPRDAYQGGVQRKKAELIEQARIKKAYARVRAERGLPAPARSAQKAPPAERGDHDDRAVPSDDEEAESGGTSSGDESAGSDRDSAEAGATGQPANLEGEEGDQGRFAPQSNPMASLLDQAEEQLTKKDQREAWRRHVQKGDDKRTIALAKKEAQAQAARRATEAREAKQAALAARQTPEEARSHARGQRARHSKLWNKPAGSKHGRARNQPNLGARVNVYLDRIKKDQGGSQR